MKELDIPCKVKPISLYEGEQKQSWYLDINPNGRIPAIGEHLANCVNTVLSKIAYLVDQSTQRSLLSVAAQLDS